MKKIISFSSLFKVNKKSGKFSHFLARESNKADACIEFSRMCASHDKYIYSP